MVSSKDLSRILLVGLVFLLNGCGGGGGDAAPALTTIPTPTSTVSLPVIPKPEGFYAMTGLSTPDAEKLALLKLPYVKGMTSYVSWKDLEPIKGQFDFSKIDSDIALAKSQGKKITLGVFTGKNSIPGWVAADGVRTWTTGQGSTLIHPTDKLFVSLWTARIQVLGTRYATNETVAMVTICGPAGTLCGPRYPELPSDVVYADLVATWSQVIAAYQTAFPRTYKNLEVHLSANGYGATLPVDLFAGVAPDVKIGPFAEFLSDVSPADGSITAVAYSSAAKGRDWCGFQMVSPLAEKVGDAVRKGHTFGCNYFEIYAGDLKQQGVILQGLVQ